MTHSLHRKGTPESLNHDFVVLTRTANGINRSGSQQQLQEYVKCAFRHNPTNLGNHNGNMFSDSQEEIVAKITEGRGSNVVFNSIDNVIDFIKELQANNYSYSVTCSCLEKNVKIICRECGLKLHSVNLSLGVFGRTEKLPRAEVLEITTMCGHHQVSPYLVEDLVQKVKNKKLTVKEAALKLIQPCPCGLVNKQRAEEIVQKLVDEP